MELGRNSSLPLLESTRYTLQCTRPLLRSPLLSARREQIIIYSAFDNSQLDASYEVINLYIAVGGNDDAGIDASFIDPSNTIDSKVVDLRARQVEVNIVVKLD